MSATARFSTSLRIEHARDLQPGQTVRLDYGIGCGSDLAVVVGHRTTPWGTHAEAVIERVDPETGAKRYERATLDGRPAAPYGPGPSPIGWKPVFRYSVKALCNRESEAYELFWIATTPSASWAEHEAREALEQAGHVVTSTEIAATELF